MNTPSKTPPAFFLVNGFGDQLIALPALRALATTFGAGQLLLGEGMLSFFYRDLPLGPEPVRAFWRDRERLEIDVERILPKTAPAELFVNISTWTSASVHALARQMGARRIVGWFEGADEVLPVDASLHMFDRLFSLAQWFAPALVIDDFTAAPRFSPVAEAAAERLVAAHVAPEERILFLHPETLPPKMWSAEAMSFVVERFLDAEPTYRVLYTAVEPFPLSVGRHAERVAWVDEHLELAMAVARHADLFLGIDSCFLHAADLIRLPSVGLFGPTSPAEWGFRLAPEARTFWGEGAMERIERGAVLDALIELARADRGARPRRQRTA